MRHLCIDLGDKRTGLAVGDTVTRLVSPLEVLEVPVSRNSGGDLLAAIEKAVTEQGARALVVGLPYNMDDSEGPRAKTVRAFAGRIALATGLPLHFQDERLTSVAADWTMARSGLTRGQKKARRDALAAAEILRDYFGTLPLATSTLPPPANP
ncbi:MAG: Holliday junction resolvase RuvX [Phycisphaerales bacterium]|nr:Holliday junction resolvase RuvX [Phycisphaerales bacterium]